mgnify:CR=1 FL=1
MKVIELITDDEHRNGLYEIISKYEEDTLLSKLKLYMLRNDYFLQFGPEPAWLAYQIYLESLK